MPSKNTPKHQLRSLKSEKFDIINLKYKGVIQMQRRLERFDAKLVQSGLDALLVTGQNNIYYLTDFWGTNATVFITKNRRLFLTDSRYTLIAKQSVHGFDIIESKDPLKDIVKFVGGR